MKKVFVTVGSTSFDKLISTLCCPEIIEVLSAKGYDSITFQIGKGSYIPKETPKIQVEWYTYKEDITADIKSASLVISHAGAGSIHDALKHLKPLIVVINEQLMDNHQEELAREYHEHGYLKCCYCSELQKTIENLETSKLVPFPTGDTEQFLALFDQIMGYR